LIGVVFRYSVSFIIENENGSGTFSIENMSVRLQFDQLSRAERDRIQKDLTFKPKAEYIYVKGRRKEVQRKDTLYGYLILNANYIRVPMLYAIRNFPSKIVYNTEWVASNINYTTDPNKQLQPKQVEPVEQCLKMLRSTGSCLKAFCTGFGKSVCMAYTIAELGGLTLFLVDSKVGLKQIPETLRQFTDAKIWMVGNDCPPETNIIVCMTTRIHKIPIEYLKLITTVVADEVHCFLTVNRYSIFFMVEPRYLILATATPSDKYGLWPALDVFVGENKVERVFERPFNVYIYHTRISVPILKQKNGMPNWTALVNDLCIHEERNEIIIKMVSDNVKKGFKILILTWRENHTHFLSNAINQLGIKSSVFAGNKETYEDAWCIIGTIAKINKAFDEATACPDFGGMRINLVMLVGSTKDPILLEQMVGRGFRAEHPNIIHLVDDVRIIKNHLKAVMPWYTDARRKGTVSEIFNNYQSGSMTKSAVVNYDRIAEAQVRTFRFSHLVQQA
jgi:superfamily II DNA or RNA helicase